MFRKKISLKRRASLFSLTPKGEGGKSEIISKNIEQVYVTWLTCSLSVSVNQESSRVT